MDGRCRGYKSWKRVIGIAVIFIILASIPKVHALDVPNSVTLSFVFNKPKSTTPYYTGSTSFTINNNKNKTLDYEIIWSNPSGITVSVYPKSGKLSPYESKTIYVDVEVSSSLSEGKYYVDLTVSDEEIHTVQLVINVEHKAEIEVDKSTLDFGAVDLSESKEISLKISEILGYKDVTVSISKVKGYDWISYPSSIIVEAGSSKTIYFKISSNKPGWEDLYGEEGKCSWEFNLKYDTATITIKIYAEIKLPAKLKVRDTSKHVTIYFDRPKSENPTFSKSVKIWVENLGYYSMDIVSVTKSGFGDLSVSISKPDSVSGYSEGLIEVDISAPSTLPEGSYYGEIHINAGSAGDEIVKINVDIRYGVKLIVSQDKIDFGEVEILKQYSKTISLREYLGYKSAENIRIVKISGNDWMSVNPSTLVGIPPGESVSIEFTLEPRGEAIPGEKYSWIYEVRSLNANTVTIKLSAKVIIISCSDINSEFEKLKNEFNKYGVLGGYSNIMDSTIDACEYAENVGGKTYRNTCYVILKISNIFKNIGDYLQDPNNKYLQLVFAGINLRSIPDDISEIPDSHLRNDLSLTYSELSSFFEKLAKAEAEKFYNIGKGYEHTNYLQASKSYEIASSIYTTINQEKAEETHKLSEKLSKKFNEIISEANDKSVKAQSLVEEAKKFMQKIGNDYYLINPLNYDDVSKRYLSAIGLYKEAINDYETAGDYVLKDYASEELKMLEEEWKVIKIRFIIYLVFLVVGFMIAMFRIIKGSLNYIRDVKELKIADDINP